MKKINVLQLSVGLGVGGAEKIILELVHNSTKSKFNHHVIGLSKSADLNFKFEEAGIKTIILNQNKSLFGFINMIKYVNKFIKQKNIDLIHAHMSHALFVSSCIKILNPKVKIVFTSHNINVGSKLREGLIRLLKPLRDIDIAFSKEQIDNKYLDNNFIIPNGINTLPYKKKIDKFEKFTFLAIGSLGKQKNHKFLIETVKDMKEYDFQVLIAGDGPLKAELINLIEEFNLNEKIKLLGLRADIPELLKQSHCFVMPSLWEGLPIAILEAGASKTPVISTPVGSIPSLLNNQNAYLCELSDFKASMIDVINNYDIAIKKANALEKIIDEDYNINSISKKHEEIYESLCVESKR